MLYTLICLILLPIAIIAVCVVIGWGARKIGEALPWIVAVCLFFWLVSLWPPLLPIIYIFFVVVLPAGIIAWWIYVKVRQRRARKNP